MKIIDLFEKIHSLIVDFIFPTRCEMCHQPIKYPNHWCENCLPKILNVHRIQKSKSVDYAIAVSNYRSGTRELIRDIKFHLHRRQILSAENLLELAFKNSETFRKLLSAQNLVAVPVPLFPEKEKLRGFNQSEIIFKNWLESHGVDMRNSLKRVVDTKPNFDLSKEEREKNLQNAFEVVDDVQGKNILIVDDIFTTGATISECSKVLKSSGANKIFVLVLASDYQ